MARVTRSSVLLKIQDILALQAGSEQVPVMANNSIQPVIESGPRFTQVSVHNFNSATAALTVYTTPRDKDFYLTYADLSVTKDVVCDCVLSNLIITQGGTSRRLLNIDMQTVTAGSFGKSLNFSYPIKLDRSAVITLNGAFGAGTLTKTACIGGFILE